MKDQKIGNRAVIDPYDYYPVMLVVKVGNSGISGCLSRIVIIGICVVALCCVAIFENSDASAERNDKVYEGKHQRIPIVLKEKYGEGVLYFNTNRNDDSFGKSLAQYLNANPTARVTAITASHEKRMRNGYWVITHIPDPSDTK